MITWNKNQIYWLEHPDHGTIKAQLVIVSTNHQSLGFSLEDPIMVRSLAGGGIVTSSLPIMNVDGVLIDVFQGLVWTAYAIEPAVKLPTK